MSHAVPSIGFFGGHLLACRIWRWWSYQQWTVDRSGACVGRNGLVRATVSIESEAVAGHELLGSASSGPIPSLHDQWLAARTKGAPRWRVTACRDLPAAVGQGRSDRQTDCRAANIGGPECGQEGRHLICRRLKTG